MTFRQSALSKKKPNNMKQQVRPIATHKDLKLVATTSVAVFLRDNGRHQQVPKSQCD